MGMVQVLEHLPCKLNALNSSTSHNKNKYNKILSYFFLISVTNSHYSCFSLADNVLFLSQRYKIFFLILHICDVSWYGFLWAYPVWFLLSILLLLFWQFWGMHSGTQGLTLTKQVFYHLIHVLGSYPKFLERMGLCHSPSSESFLSLFI